jgi:hypothetical protein
LSAGGFGFGGFEGLLGSPAGGLGRLLGFLEGSAGTLQFRLGGTGVLSRLFNLVLCAVGLVNNAPHLCGRQNVRGSLRGSLHCGDRGDTTRLTETPHFCNIGNVTIG